MREIVELYKLEMEHEDNITGIIERLREIADVLEKIGYDSKQNHGYCWCIQPIKEFSDHERG